jgi:hypothetical protein
MRKIELSWLQLLQKQQTAVKKKVGVCYRPERAV